MITSLNRATTLNIILLQIELLITLKVINSPFHNNLDHRRCQNDLQDPNKEQEQHCANRLYLHSNAKGNVQPGFFSGRRDAPGQQLWDNGVPRNHHLPMGIPVASGHHNRVSKPSVSKKMPHCIRCKERHPPTPCTTAFLRCGTRISNSRKGSSSEISSMNAACSCSRSTSTGAGHCVRYTQPTAGTGSSMGPDIGPGTWIAHTMIRNTTSRRAKARGNCWDKSESVASQSSPAATRRS